MFFGRPVVRVRGEISWHVSHAGHEVLTSRTMNSARARVAAHPNTLILDFAIAVSFASHRSSLLGEPAGIAPYTRRAAELDAVFDGDPSAATCELPAAGGRETKRSGNPGNCVMQRGFSELFAERLSDIETRVGEVRAQCDQCEERFESSVSAQKQQNFQDRGFVLEARLKTSESRKNMSGKVLKQYIER